jgi:DNA-directed RNA polymerase specialized sigma24 family protein
MATGTRALARWAGLRRPEVAHLEIEVVTRSETYRRIAKLPMQQRAVAVLSFLEDMTAEDIARTLGISPSSVRTHLQRIRRRLADDTHAEIAEDQQSMRPGGRQS